MSAEILTVVISAASLLVALGGGGFAGLAWVIRNTNGLRGELKTDIADLRTEIKTDINGLRDEIGELHDDVVDLKVAVARLEGPSTQRLLLPR